jgi:Amt family ammonium transporter
MVESSSREYGGGLAVFKAQCVGSLIVCSATFATAMAMFKALNAVNLRRVSRQGEIEGLDVDQHGNAAYPEYVISTLTASHAMGREAVDGTSLPSAVVGAE